MSNLIEIETRDSDNELIFPCDARDGGYLRLTWDDVDDDWRFLYVEEAYQFERLRDRIRNAFRVLSARPIYVGSVVLTNETAESIRDFLVEKTAK